MTMDPVHAVLNQAPPLENFNRYLGNRAMRDAIAREGAAWAHAQLAQAGVELGRADWIARGEQANQYPPRPRIFSRYGHRLDEFEFHSAWDDCLSWLKSHGVAGSTWDAPRPGAHVRRAALFQLFAEIECGSLCPATMTHSAVPLLRREPALHEPWLHRALAARHDERFIPAADKRGVLIGMGMTERQGGSDVRANLTQAVATENGWYRLTGHKWFLSVPMSDAFVVTAQAPGGLSCFFLPRFTPDGRRNALRIQRAKDKLGDRSNASAEVEFHGALAYRLGEEGRGLSSILEMANHTRLDCANGSAGIMRAALSQALHHARHRRAFGSTLANRPLMKNVLADMALEVEGHVALCLHVAGLIDRGQSDPEAATLARLLIPVTKYWVCRRTTALVTEAMEVIGGNGYVEDDPMPRLFRQSPLNSIWEGAGNMMCLDVLRVLARQARAVEKLLAELERQSRLDARYDRALAQLKHALVNETRDEAGARGLTQRIAVQAQAAILLSAGTTPTAEAFCASRLDSAHCGYAFGTLCASTDFDALIARAAP